MEPNTEQSTAPRCSCGTLLDSLDVRLDRQECTDCWIQRVTPTSDTLPPLDFSRTERCPPPEMKVGTFEWAQTMGVVRV